MQQLAQNVYIENGYPGVTLGAVTLPQGTILVDCPFRVEDSRAWRSACNAVSASPGRIMANLDSHYDRTIGARAMEMPVLAQDKVAEVIRSRPLNYRVQGCDSGADWQLYNLSGSIRWVIPEISFSERIYIHWDDQPVLMEAHPGPASGSAWLVIPHEHIAFIGDTVTPGQPPFLAFANLPAWQDSLQLLLAPEYNEYVLISGRGGTVVRAQVEEQLAFLGMVRDGLQSLAARHGKTLNLPALLQDITALADHLAAQAPGQPYNDSKALQRLRFGLRQLFIRQYHPTAEHAEE